RPGGDREHAPLHAEHHPDQRTDQEDPGVRRPHTRHGGRTTTRRDLGHQPRRGRVLPHAPHPRRHRRRGQPLVRPLTRHPPPTPTTTPSTTHHPNGPWTSTSPRPCSPTRSASSKASPPRATPGSTANQAPLPHPNPTRPRSRHAPSCSPPAPGNLRSTDHIGE